MNEKQARYIVMILDLWRSSPQGVFWPDSTDVDYAEYDRIIERYEELKWSGSFHEAMQTAMKEFILRIANEGIPEGAGIV